MSRDFRWLAEELLKRGQDLVAAWLPGGRAAGHEWICGGIAGSPGRSLSVNLHTGAWADFSAPDLKGRDLISLAAAIRQCSQVQAFDALVDELRLTSPDAARPAKPASPAAVPERVQLVPAPDDAPPWRSFLERLPTWLADLRATFQQAWEYRDAAGRLLQVVCRFDVPDPNQPKTYAPITCHRGRGGRLYWLTKGPAKPWPLYRLDLLAARPRAKVVVVEGEKAADALQAELGDGWVVTASPAGAKNAGHADWSPLVGRSAPVYGWRDNDEPGQAYIDAVRGQVPQLLELDLAGLPWQPGPGDDAADVPDQAWPAIVAALETSPPIVARAVPAGAPAAQGGEGAPVAVEPEAPPRAKRRSNRTAFDVLVDDWRSFIRGQGLWPDAMHAWRHDDGRQAETGDADLTTRWVYSMLQRDWEPVAEQVRVCVTVEIADRRAERRAALLAGLIGTPATPRGQAELATMVRAWIGRDDPLMVAVVAQWLWQVKRRAAALPVDWDLMPVLVGGQGGGKTTAVARLAAPFQELAVPITANQITDQREAPLLARALIGIWDEMSGASKADTEALKRAISATQSAWRQLHSHTFETRRRTITFFGSSNLPISSIIRDTTGARRYAEIAVGVLDWEAVNAIDYRLVWQAVSEADAAPILPHLQALRAHQRALVHSDLMTAWLSDEISQGMGKLVITRSDCPDADIIPAYDGDPGGWTLAQIAGRIAFFGRPFGQGKVDPSALPARLRQLGWSDRRVRVGDRASNRREYRWFLDPAIRAEAAAPSPDDDPLADLRAALARAIAAEDYETAARLRDQIRGAEPAAPSPAPAADPLPPLLEGADDAPW